LFDTGLKAGKTFTPDEAGELVAVVPPLPTDEAAGEEQADSDAAAAAAAAAAGGASTSAAAEGVAASIPAAAAAAAAAGTGANNPAGAADGAGQKGGRKQGKGLSKRQKKQAAKQQQQQQQQQVVPKPAKKTKNLTFSAYDRQVLEQMPAFIREQVPFLTTAKGAIDTTLLQMFKLLAVSDVGFNNLVNRLHELHHWQYYKQMLIYYSFAKSVKDEERARRGELRTWLGSVLADVDLHPCLAVGGCD
jgi:hypothetical protein